MKLWLSLLGRYEWIFKRLFIQFTVYLSVYLRAKRCWWSKSFANGLQKRYCTRSALPLRSTDDILRTRRGWNHPIITSNKGSLSQFPPSCDNYAHTYPKLSEFSLLPYARHVLIRYFLPVFYYDPWEPSIHTKHLPLTFCPFWKASFTVIRTFKLKVSSIRGKKKNPKWRIWWRMISNISYRWWDQPRRISLYNSSVFLRLLQYVFFFFFVYSDVYALSAWS